MPLPATAAMDAVRADGVVWRRHWTLDLALVVEFVDLACVSVGRDGTLTFDRDLEPELEEHLFFDHVLPLVLAHDGHSVLHGGVVSREGRGLALVGSSGAGKSTLAGHLWRRGWTMGNDDGMVISTSPRVRAEPTYSTLRLTPAGAELVGLDPTLASPVVGKLRFDDRAGTPFRQAPVDLVAVALIEPDDGAEASFQRMSGMDAHAELFGSTFHADFTRDRHLPHVLADLATVAESCAVGRLRVPRGRSGLASAEGLLRTLVDRPAPA